MIPTLSVKPFTNELLIARIFVHLQSQVSKKYLEHQIDENVPNYLKGDPTRLRQIIINLSGNAAKFVDKGKVLLRVSFIEEKDNHINLRFEIIDTGIGISQSKIDTLVKSFSQVNASTTREYGGTGMGLTIAKPLNRNNLAEAFKRVHYI